MPEADRRLESGREGAGMMSGSPVDRLVAAFRGGPVATEYYDWVNAPSGKLVVAALRHLALHGPARCEGDSVAVQYGVTLGLSLAADLLADPTSVIPALSAPQMPVADAFSPDYMTSPDELIEKGEQ